MDSSSVDVEVRDRAIAQVISASASIERLATGFAWTEGAAWSGPERALVFSDIPNDRLYRWRPDEGIEVVRGPSNMANGNTYDNEWRLVTCEHATSRLTRTGADNQIEVLADRYEGKELNSPNDVVVKKDGSVYFTDPTYGRQAFFGRPRPAELPHRGVYKLGRDNELSLLAPDFDQPNGLCFSPDESILYVNDTERGHIRTFNVRSDGALEKGSLFAKVTGTGDGSPDGMKTDVDGRVYCTGPGGIHVFNPEGICLGVIHTPEAVANFSWGGEARTDLYICAATSLYRIATSVAGNVR